MTPAMWFCLIITVVAICYAVAKGSDAAYWQRRCEAVEQGYADEECERVVNTHHRKSIHPGPVYIFGKESSA